MPMTPKKREVVLKRMEHHCPGLLNRMDGQHGWPGEIAMPLDWLEELVDLLDRREVQANVRDHCEMCPQCGSIDVKVVSCSDDDEGVVHYECCAACDFRKNRLP